MVSMMDAVFGWNAWYNFCAVDWKDSCYYYYTRSTSLWNSNSVTFGECWYCKWYMSLFKYKSPGSFKLSRFWVGSKDLGLYLNDLLSFSNKFSYLAAAPNLACLKTSAAMVQSAATATAKQLNIANPRWQKEMRSPWASDFDSLWLKIVAGGEDFVRRHCVDLSRKKQSAMAAPFRTSVPAW